MKERLLDVMKFGLIIIIGGGVFYFVSQGREFTILLMTITAFATGCIAYYAWRSHVFVLNIQSRHDEFRGDIKKLYRALVISNLIDPNVEITSGQGTRAVETFNELYEKGNKGQIVLRFP